MARMVQHQQRIQTQLGKLPPHPKAMLTVKDVINQQIQAIQQEIVLHQASILIQDGIIINLKANYHPISTIMALIRRMDLAMRSLIKRRLVTISFHRMLFQLRAITTVERRKSNS